jgi:hypothetical protein
MSTIFQWNPADIKDLLATCETDGLLPLILKYMPQGSTILESGCGLGRYVRYLEGGGRQSVGFAWFQGTPNATNVCRHPFVAVVKH